MLQETFTVGVQLFKYRPPNASKGIQLCNSRDQKERIRLENVMAITRRAHSLHASRNFYHFDQSQIFFFVDFFHCNHVEHNKMESKQPNIYTHTHAILPQIRVNKYYLQRPMAQVSLFESSFFLNEAQIICIQNSGT